MAKIDYSTLKKGGFMRQKQKGYFSLRIQVVGGNLTSENIRAVADVADKYGKGYVHMTSRQGVEIPFINFDNIEEVRAELADLVVLLTHDLGAEDAAGGIQRVHSGIDALRSNVTAQDRGGIQMGEGGGRPDSQKEK